MNDIKKRLKSLFPHTIIFTFLLVQLNYINKAGTTYDADGLRFGANIVIKKIERIISFNTNFSDLPFSDVEFYGMLVILPAYIFSHFFKRFINNPSDYGFENIDGLIYFLMNMYLIIYVVICLFFIIKKLNTISKNFTISFLLILLLTPSFSGHSLFNLKDIPFALQLFLFALLFNEYIENIIKNKTYNLNLKLGLLTGLALSVRLNAIFFISLIFFIGIVILHKKEKLTFNKVSKDFIKILLIGFLFLYIFTPSAWLDPIQWVNNAIYQQFFLEWSGSTLTNGEFIVATEMKWNYLLTWFFYKLPLIFHLSILIYFYLKFKGVSMTLLSDVSVYFLIMVFLIFSLVRPSVYDGIRQFLFLIPFFATFSAETFLKFLDYKKIPNSFLFIPILLYLFFTQFGLGPYRYVYFNEFVDVKKISIECNNLDGCGTWPTDYWGFSGREVAEYLNKNLLEGEIPNKSEFAWRDNSTSLLICRPSMTAQTYMNKNLNYNKLNIGDFSRSEIITLTYHRPRYDDDSCRFLINEVDYLCKTISTFNTKMRFQDVVLAHVKECKI